MDTDLLDLAIESAIAGSLAILNTTDSSVKHKADESPVTQADLNSNAAISELLAPSGIPIISEEGDTHQLSNKRYWLVDPLDGTREFILGREHFTVNINLMENDIPVLAAIAVPRKETVYFGNGITTSKSSFDLDKVTILKPKEPTEITVAVSQSHLSGKTLEYVKSMAGSGQHIRTIRAGSAVKFCMILDGLATVYPRFSPFMEWDIAAGHLLLKGVGKNIVDLNTGREMEYGKPERLNGAFVAR